MECLYQRRKKFPITAKHRKIKNKEFRPETWNFYRKKMNVMLKKYEKRIITHHLRTKCVKAMMLLRLALYPTDAFG